MSDGLDLAAIAVEQRLRLRRILIAFVAIGVLLPIAGIGDAFAWLLVPMLVLAAWALREGILLRRSVNRHGVQRPQ